jgi:hypothetical protein
VAVEYSPIDIVEPSDSTVEAGRTSAGLLVVGGSEEMFGRRMIDM